MYYNPIKNTKIEEFTFLGYPQIILFMIRSGYSATLAPFVVSYMQILKVLEETHFNVILICEPI